MRKMHVYAIFVLQKLKEDNRMTMDFDPASLDISMVHEFHATNLTQPKKPKTSIIQTSVKHDIIKTIVSNFNETNFCNTGLMIQDNPVDKN